MPEFNFYIDQKVTIWERSHYSVKAETEEEAEQIMLKEFEDLFHSEEEARTKGIPEIKKRYERQGYYSSNARKIPLNELEKHCKIVAL